MAIQSRDAGKLLMLLALGGLAVGCSQPHKKFPASSNEEAERDQATSDSTVIFTDRLEEISPNARQLTERNFEALHGALETFIARHGQYPRKLRQLLDMPWENEFTRPQRGWLLDGWGRAITYSREASSYKLVSSGADGILGTSDDLISRPHT